MLDTAGAGDWATAALLHSLRTSEGITSTVSDKQLNHAFEFAQAAAAWACKFEGARGGMYAASPEEFSSDVAAISRQTELQSIIGDKGSALRKLPPTVCPSCS
jgi:fructokinase